MLFLDEIGELDLELQAKLLRVLQERRVRCLGDTGETPVDVRIVVATHRDLRQMVKDQCFRADLLSRLWVYPIQLAPLRRRREDIPALVQHFVGKHSSVLAVTVEAAFTQALQQTQLEGNIRQLENIVQRALANMDTTRSLGLAQLPPEIWDELAAPDDGPPGPAVAVLDQDLNLSRALICHERRWCWRRCGEAVVTRRRPPSCWASLRAPCTPSSASTTWRRAMPAHSFTHHFILGLRPPAP